MSGGYARIVRSVKPAGRRAYVPEWGMILGNDGVRGSGALSYELVCATAGRIHVVAYRLTDDRGVANGKRARIITERLRLGGSAVRRVVRHCEKARRENKRPTRPTPPSPWRLVGHIRRSRIGVQRPAHAPRGPAGAAVHPRDRIRDAVVRDSRRARADTVGHLAPLDRHADGARLHRPPGVVAVAVLQRVHEAAGGRRRGHGIDPGGHRRHDRPRDDLQRLQRPCGREGHRRHRAGSARRSARVAGDDERFRQEARRGGHPQLSAVFAGFVVGRCLRQRHLVRDRARASGR